MKFTVAITDDKRITGINCLADGGTRVRRFMALIDFLEMLRTDWDSDAHFVTYVAYNPDGTLPDSMPRVNKPALGEIKEKGGSVKSWGCVFDWDLKDNVDDQVLRDLGWDGNPKKKPSVPWDDEKLRDFYALLEGAIGSLSERGLGPACVYLTTHGARFVHVYAHEVDVRKQEPMVRGMIREYEKIGLLMDPQCADWTRMFRAPRVVRDGKLTTHHSWFRSWEYDDWTVPESVPQVEKTYADTYGDAPDYVGDQPSPEEALSMLEEVAPGGGMRKTDAYRHLKGLLYRRGCDDLYDALTKQVLPIPEGARDSRLTQLVGQAANHLYTMPWGSPELIYATLLPVVQEMEPDAGTPDWERKLWGLCCRMWSLESKKERKVEAERQEEEEQKAEDLDSFLEVVKLRYPGVEKLHGPDAYGEVSRMGLVKVGRWIYVIRPDGYYHPRPCSGSTLPGTIADLGSDFLMPTKIVGKRGGVYHLDAKELLAAHGRECTRVVGIYGVPGGYLDETGALMMPLFQFADLTGERSEHVEQWLRYLFGKNYQIAAKWLAYAQDMSRPICGAAFIGPPGVGKKMLARGLSELIAGAPVAASGSDLVDDFTPALMRGPFIVVDEGLPIGNHQKRDVSDIFRRAVAGESVWVNTKNNPQVEVHVPYRVIFTANNREVIHGLVGTRTLTAYDREAMAERILYVELQEKAATWLRSRGGWGLTRGWIAGDSGIPPSNFVLARHLRYLYENRYELFGPPESDRYLVSGDIRSGIVDDLRVLSGVTPEVAKTCIYIIEHKELAPEVMRCVSIEDGHVWITTNAVTYYYNHDSGFDRKVKMNEKNVGVALENLSLQTDRTTKTTLMRDGAGFISRQLRWRRLDLPFLLRHAREHGLPTTQLEELVGERRVHEPSRT